MLYLILALGFTLTCWACYELGKRRERDVWHARVREQVARMSKPVVPSFFDGTACAEPDEYPAVSNVVMLRGRAGV